MHYHVLLSQDNSPALRCVLRDLDARGLRTGFLKPYKAGKTLLCGSEIITSESVRRVSIVTTERSMELSLARANDEAEAHRQELNRGSPGLVFIGGTGYGPDDVTKFGTDVTAEFIKQAPKRPGSHSVLASLLSNPWLVGVGGAVAAAGITAWLKWT